MSVKKSLVLGLAFAVGAAASATRADAQVIYSNIPGNPDPNYASQPYQAQQVSEFGNLLHLGAGSRDLSQVSFLMSTWAIGSDYPTLLAQNAGGWTHDFTLNLYNVGSGGTVGSLINSFTQNSLIAWRPEADPSCGTRWLASDNNCYNGMATRLDFNFASGTIVVPNDVIVSLAFNTQSYGAQPIGAGGPFNSLNVAIGPEPTTVGSNDFGVAYVATTYPGWMPDGSFQRDTGWDTYAPMIEVSAVVATPEPASLALLATGLIGVAGWSRRRRTA